jgi:8-oxo-dGTP pyrophosphatase MutT (NUDIX family)
MNSNSTLTDIKNNQTSLVHFYSHLREALVRDLPGIEAQRQLAIVGRKLFAQQREDARQAAVCAVLYPHEATIRLAYIVRAAHEDDRHGGQISFPGGKVEVEDEDLSHTALRELREETGISVEKSQVLGALTSLYIPVSNFMVHPFVIGLHEKPEVLRQESEVDEIFGHDLHHLLSLPIGRKQITGYGFTIPSAPYFDLNGRTLWGATAMMTNELLEVVRGI